MVKDELMELLGGPSVDDLLNVDLEGPLEGDCMQDQGLGCSLLADAKFRLPVDVHIGQKGRFGRGPMNHRSNHPILTDHGPPYGVDPGAASADFYRKFHRSMQTEDTCDTDEQSSGDTLGIFQLDEPGLDYHRQTTGTLIPDILSSESSRSPISQLPEYHFSAGASSQQCLSRSHPAMTRKVPTGCPYNIQQPSYHIGNAHALSHVQSMNAPTAVPMGHSTASTLSQGLVPNLTQPLGGSHLHPNTIDKGLVLPSMHKPNFGAMYDMRSLHRMSAQSLFSPRESTPHAASVMNGCSETERSYSSWRMATNASSPPRWMPVDSLKKRTPPALSSLVDSSQHPSQVLHNTRIPGTLSKEEREQRILKYRQKRMDRRFDRRVTYPCRKTLADTRPRVRGRFAKNGDKDAVMPGCGKAGGCKRKFESVPVDENLKENFKGRNMGDQENILPQQHGGNKSLIDGAQNFGHS